jgi:hypothetical protein
MPRSIPPLHEAIALGRMLVKATTHCTLVAGEGCACGMALAAVGEVQGSAATMKQFWPWANILVWWEITLMFNDVERGFMTLDQLIDSVKQMDPTLAAAPLAPTEVEPEAEPQFQMSNL